LQEGVDAILRDAGEDVKGLGETHGDLQKVPMR
jgi:hypothetical protein